MTLAFLNKKKPTELRRFIGYLDQLAGFCVHKLKINPMNREDIKQIAVEHAFKKMDLYDPESGSAAYSYFYKVIYMRCLYELRSEHQKKSHSLPTCSLDVYQNMIGDSDEGIIRPDNNHLVNINGNIYDKKQIMDKVHEARTLVRKNNLIVKRNKLYSEKNNKYINPSDNFVRMTCHQIIEKKMKKQLMF